MSETWLLTIGITAALCAITALFIAAFGWRSNRLSIERRIRPGAAVPEGALAAPSRRVANTLEGKLLGPGRTKRLATALDLAGISLRAGDFVLLVLASTLAAAAVGLLAFGALAAVLLTPLAPAAAAFTVKIRTERRRAAFADQLEDSVQLLAGGLRAGHSLLRAFDAAATESESPTAEEFARVINETRVGRPLVASLEDTAARMASNDFAWLVQAIAIHQEVGGDLAEVLDTVGQTLRERNQIRRQVRALSAEGRLSGYVLMALPLGVAGFLTIANPGYLAKLTVSPIGWGMIAAAVMLIAVGGLWLRKVVSLSF